MKHRTPRKIKKKIPKGHYCYTNLYPIFDEDGNYKGTRIKLCPFFSYIKMKDIPKDSTDKIMKEVSVDYPDEKIGWCKKINFSIDDQCKSCSINIGKW